MMSMHEDRSPEDGAPEHGLLVVPRVGRRVLQAGLHIGVPLQAIPPFLLAVALRRILACNIRQALEVPAAPDLLMVARLAASILQPTSQMPCSLGRSCRWMRFRLGNSLQFADPLKTILRSPHHMIWRVSKLSKPCDSAKWVAYISLGQWSRCSNVSPTNAVSQRPTETLQLQM